MLALLPLILSSLVGCFALVMQRRFRISRRGHTPDSTERGFMRRAYQFCLLIYPRRHRDQFAEEMLGAFEEAFAEWQDRRSLTIRFACAEFAGLIGCAAVIVSIELLQRSIALRVTSDQVSIVRQQIPA
jgi:hypothetical protein